MQQKQTEIPALKDNSATEEPQGEGRDERPGVATIAQPMERRSRGIPMQRHFTEAGVDPLDQVDWEKRDAVITGEDGEKVFEQKDVEVPLAWSQMATNVVSQKYFRGLLGTKAREGSVRQVVERVTKTISRWGVEQGYFSTDADAETFRHELSYLLVNQHVAFNSPVWFNVGVEREPQCSACFINSVDDTMESILDLAKTEGMLFKWGSGTGTNFSSLRSCKEPLGGGGTASGPVSFMRGFDAFAGVIKSGGKTRRAAKMVILNADHPDVEEFVSCKSNEEKKACALIDAGYDGSFNGEAYGSVFFQNSNNSVRVTDEFMEAVNKGRQWHLRAVTNGEILETIPARSLMRTIAESAWACGDPGMQYDTTVNSWHTCPASGRINASNPCSEYMFLDNSACNLASLNLRKFQNDEGHLDIDAFRWAVDVTVLAQEIVVDAARYPTPEITENSKRFRPLGLGYANLGALLMSRGLPYDSDAGRAYAAAVTGLMHGEANRMSAIIAGDRGPFETFQVNAPHMLAVMERHRRALDDIDSPFVPYDLMQEIRKVWDDVLSLGLQNGFRNAQVTVLAPTGTIAFMMDCDTTGIEPDMALVKYKKLVGGGLFKIVNGTVPEALERLGYSEDERQEIIDFIEDNDTIEGAPYLKDEHLPVFDCAFKPLNGERCISHMGHLRMMGAVQNFLSGAISKTVNLPNEVTVEDVEEVYIEAWRLGLKAIALYRDGCKRIQPMSVGKDEEEVTEEEAATAKTVGPPEAVRHKLPDERLAITHKFSIAGHEGYLTVGCYPDGRPGEIFIVMAKEGSTISGLMDSFALAVSVALQHGTPLKTLVEKFSYTRFEPQGFTGNPQIRNAHSVMDYIFRWLNLKFPGGVLEGSHAVPGSAPDHPAVPDIPPRSMAAEEKTEPFMPPTTARPAVGNRSASFVRETDAPPCPECGSITVRNGACHKCLNCGATTGCS